jgi:Tol biopolymer transport system component
MRSPSVVRREGSAAALMLLSLLVVSACSSDSSTGPNSGANSKDQVILYTAFDPETGRGRTFGMSPDGTARVPVSSTSIDEVSPVLSPDGKRIAVVRIVDTLPQVFVTDADGSYARLATNVLGGAFWPSWTSDGASIMFSNFGELKTWMVHADGTNAHRMTEAEADEQLPALSPDGTRVVFTSARQFSGTYRVFELFTMNIDGTNVQRLTTSPDLTMGYNIYARWSPDGSRIAFLRSINGGVTHVFIMSADGSGMRQLTNGDLNDLGLAWSPDGKQLAISRESIGGLGEIYVTDANDGKRLLNITNTVNVDEEYPSWGVHAR